MALPLADGHRQLRVPAQEGEEARHLRVCVSITAWSTEHCGTLRLVSGLRHLRGCVLQLEHHVMPEKGEVSLLFLQV